MDESLFYLSSLGEVEGKERLKKKGPDEWTDVRTDGQWGRERKSGRLLVGGLPLLINADVPAR